MRPPRWTDEEKAALELLAGNVLPNLLSGTYNRWAKKHGYPPRTKVAILSAMSHRRISRKAEGDWMTASYIARILGVSIDVPQRWAERDLIENYKKANNKATRYFKRSGLIDFAKKHPHLLGGIDSNRLFLLLEDQELADSIAERFPKRPGSGRMVQAIESGRIYESVSAAAREVFATHQGIQSAMRTGGTCAGFHWRRIYSDELSTFSQAA